MSTNSTWTALRNPVFRSMWVASLISGTCVAAQDTAATWTMNRVSDSPLFLSLMSTVASLPFFFFTLPAGALADMVDRKRMMFVMTIWLAIAAGGLAIVGWFHLINAWILLTAVFFIGTGFAFYSPAWTSIQPEIVSNDELPSASTLGGLQLNISGIIGPAIGGALLRFVSPNAVFAMNSIFFLLLLIAIHRLKHPKPPSNLPLENFLESFISAIRYVRYTSGIQIVLARNLLFAFFISIIPALIPVVGLKELHLDPSDLGISVYVHGRWFGPWSGIHPPMGESQISLKHGHSSCKYPGRGRLFPDGDSSGSKIFLYGGRLRRNGVDDGGLRALGCRSASNAKLGTRSNECHNHHGCTGCHGAWRDRLGIVSFHVGCKMDSARCLFPATGDVAASILVVDRFHQQT